MDVPNGVVEGFSEWPYGTSVMAVGSQQRNAFVQSGRTCEANPYLKDVTSALKRTDVPSLPAAHSSVKKWKNPFNQNIEPLSTFQFPFQKVNGTVIPNTSPNAWNKADNPSGKHAIIISVDETRPHCEGVAQDNLVTMVDASAPLMPSNQKMLLHNPTKKDLFHAAKMTAQSMEKNPNKPTEVLIAYQGDGGVVEDLSAPHNQKLKETEGALTGGLSLGNRETLHESDFYKILAFFPEEAHKLFDVNACNSAAWLNAVPPKTQDSHSEKSLLGRIQSYFFP